MTYNQPPPPPAPGAGRHPAHSVLLAPTASKHIRLIALLAVVLIAIATSCHSKPSGGELVLTAATDPGANAFMPPAASPPPTDTQPPPTLQPQGDGSAVETQPLPGDREGLYGGTDNNAGVDPDKMVNFLGANPTQAGAFVDALNSDPTVYWSGRRRLVVADIPAYLRELTPAVLRLDTRITDHGFDGTHATALQSVFQRGTALLVDAHGVPRVRGLSGNPLTAPIALRGEPKFVGAAWPGYRPGALAQVLAATAAIANFVLVDVVTGRAFNRPVGTIGANDTPHTQPVAEPAPDTSTPSATGHTLQNDIDGTYLFHYLSAVCAGYTQNRPDESITVTQQGTTIHMTVGKGISGPLSADRSFVATGTFQTAQGHDYTHTFRGVFATEGGRTIIRNGEWTAEGSAFGPAGGCHYTYTATKQ
jgi:hypothetical protein